MGKAMNILQIRPPKRDAVKRHYYANVHTRHGKIWAVITGVTALAMAAALLLPNNAVVRFFGGYGLACFLPMINLLQLRKWNRTLAYPVALLFSSIALLTLLADFSFNNALTTLFLCVTLMLGATSDRLSPIYKWKPPLDHFGLAAVAFLLYLVIYFAFMFLAGGILMAILLLSLALLAIQSLFRQRRTRRWF